MKLICLGSSSRGNCYILKADSGQILIIEAGIPYTKVKQAINYNVGNITGVLLSHSHRDHAGYIQQFQAVEVYASKETGEEIGLLSHFHAVEECKQFELGEFTVIPFSVKHDVKCFGYLIRHDESGTILFVTDCCYLPYTFGSLNNILVECNYRLDILDANIAAGRIPAVVRNRTLKSHFSYDHCVQALQANDIKGVNNIVLIHLSDGNSDGKAFREGVKAATGKRVYIAEPGLEIPFNKTPF